LVLGDPLRLGQILINLIGNAIKFTQTGQVLVAVEADPVIAGMLKFTVTDTGIGIAAGQRDLLFHPFSQADSSTSRKYGGSGLGLAIVARLVALMRGTVEVASEPGSGSAFSFTAQFEVAPTPQPSESQHRAGVQAERPGDRLAPPAIVPACAPSTIREQPLRILMADDSSDNRALIRAYLKKTPYLLVEAEDGQEAIEKFIAGKFDLVLMDIQMPIVDGFEATSTIRVWELANGRRRTPIVALTASATGEAMHRTLEAGCDAHVTKPVKKSTLLDAIRNAIEAAALDDDRDNVANLKEETCRTE
jgi:CheY-like chemotaxis protein/anti-sigma regulatory factor (Ser/Thr protein kinase)